MISSFQSAIRGIFLVLHCFLGFYLNLCAAFKTDCSPSSCRVWNDGCNRCHCSEQGGIVCTVRACAEDTEPYCITWFDTSDEI